MNVAGASPQRGHARDRVAASKVHLNDDIRILARDVMTCPGAPRAPGHPPFPTGWS